MKKIALLAVLVMVFAGTPPGHTQTVGELRNVITADSLKSGNYKDVLTSFFQLAFKNLTGPAKELKINSNPFAVMARANPRLLNGENWYSYRHLRALNLAAGIGLDSNYKLKNFSAGVKYAIVNSRDLTSNKAFYGTIAASSEANSRTMLNMFITAQISRFPSDHAKQLKLMNTSKHLQPGAEEPWSFDDLQKQGTELYNVIKEAYESASKEDQLKYEYVKWLIDHPSVKPSDRYVEYYNHLRDEWLQKPLWTIYADGTSYSDQFAFEHANVGSQFLAGIAANGTRTFTSEFDLKAQVSFTNDPLKAGRNLERFIFSFEPGINFAFRNQNDNKSFLEFKLSGSYHNILSGAQVAEKQDSLTMNAEVRLRVYDDIWVPISIRYDPEHQNLFGFLNISANFTGLKNIVGAAMRREDQ